MQLRKGVMIMAMSVLACILFSYTAMAQESKLIVVANKATYQEAQEWVDFLVSKEVPVQHVTPSDFAKYKKQKYIVIMAGMDEAEGIADIVKEVLSADEFKWLSEEGNRRMYIKADVWAERQSILLFGGSSRSAAESARKASKEDWYNYICDWFDIEQDATALYGY